MLSPSYHFLYTSTDRTLQGPLPQPWLSFSTKSQRVSLTSRSIFVRRYTGTSGKWRRLPFSCHGSRWGIPFPYNRFGSAGGLDASHPLRQNLDAFIGMLTVSKQISCESLDYLYSHTPFQVGIGPHSTHWPAKGIASHIRHLKLYIPCWTVVLPCWRVRLFPWFSRVPESCASISTNRCLSSVLPRKSPCTWIG